MKREEFLEFIKQSEAIPSNSIKDFDELVKMYPFFSGAHTMLSLALNQSKDIRFPEVLKNASLYSGDRNVLYNLLFKKNQKFKTKEIEKTDFGTTEKTAEQVFRKEVLNNEVIETASVDIVSLIQNYPEINLIDIKEKNEEIQKIPIEELAQEKEKEEGESHELIKDLTGKHSFYDWLNQYKSVGKAKQKIAIIEADTEGSFIQKEQLIERFIQTEPRISKPVKTEFFSPIIMAKKSVEDNDDIVSETLAKIYAEQGNIEKAIRIYQKLSLLYPDKSGYFAALIQKLENPDLI